MGRRRVKKELPGDQIVRKLKAELKQQEKTARLARQLAQEAPQVGTWEPPGGTLPPAREENPPAVANNRFAYLKQVRQPFIRKASPTPTYVPDLEDKPTRVAKAEQVAPHPPSGSPDAALVAPQMDRSDQLKPNLVDSSPSSMSPSPEQQPFSQEQKQFAPGELCPLLGCACQGPKCSWFSPMTWDEAGSCIIPSLALQMSDVSKKISSLMREWDHLIAELRGD